MTTQTRLADDDPRVVAAVEATTRVQVAVRSTQRALNALLAAKQRTQAAKEDVEGCKGSAWNTGNAFRALKHALALQKADQAAYDRENALLADARQWKTPFCRLDVQAALAETVTAATESFSEGVR